MDVASSSELLIPQPVGWPKAGRCHNRLATVTATISPSTEMTDTQDGEIQQVVGSWETYGMGRTSKCPAMSRPCSTRSSTHTRVGCPTGGLDGKEVADDGRWSWSPSSTRSRCSRTLSRCCSKTSPASVPTRGPRGPTPGMNIDAIVPAVCPTWVGEVPAHPTRKHAATNPGTAIRFIRRWYATSIPFA